MEEEEQKGKKVQTQRRPLAKTVRKLAKKAGYTYWIDRNSMRYVKLKPLPPHRTYINEDGLEVIGCKYSALGSCMAMSERLPCTEDAVRLATRRNISRTKLIDNGRIKPLTSIERKQSWRNRKTLTPSEIELKQTLQKDKRNLQKKKRKLADKLRKQKKKLEMEKKKGEKKLMVLNPPK
jgi:hypothetical protein